MAIAPFDLRSIFSLRETIAALDPEGEPAFRPVTGPVRGGNRVALLPGSFDPPTAAHVMLAERARTEGFDHVTFVYARNTVGKQSTGLIAEDRLLTLRAAAGGDADVLVCSHGLYADQVEAAARSFPGAELAVLVGSDKVPQIFDHSWYGDRERALDRLFSSARLIVAPRAEQDETLDRVLAARDNARWAGRVEVVRLHPAVSELSSTRVRGLLRAGADAHGLVPRDVATFLAAVRAYASPLVIGSEEVDAYAVRARLIDALWTARGPDTDAADLRRLVEIALSPTEAGRRLRGMLDNGAVGTRELAELQAV